MQVTPYIICFLSMVSVVVALQMAESWVRKCRKQAASAKRQMDYIDHGC